MTTYEIRRSQDAGAVRWTLIATDRHGQTTDLNAQGEPVRTTRALRRWIRELYRAGTFEDGIDGEHVEVSRRAAEIRDDLLAQIPRPLSTSMLIRMSPEQKRAIEQAADRAGQDAGTWLRDLGLRAAKRS